MGRKMRLTGREGTIRELIGRHPRSTANVDLISRVHPKAALYEPPPPRQPGSRGRARKKGPRLPGMADWASRAG